MNKIIFLHVIGLILSCLSAIESYQISNEWWCRNETDCLPWNEEKNPPVERLFETQNLCRLMCGKFGGLWPRPSGMCELAKSTMTITTNLIRFEYPDTTDELLRDFFDQTTFLFTKNLNDECGNICNMPSENEMFVQIVVGKLSLALNSKTIESYQLNITSTENSVIARILAETPFGIRHGLETLSQLMTKVLDDKNRAGLLMVTSALITDKPAYQHRGLLIDSARHFIPVETILKILDGMAINKMNVFHWHITDSQSFPMEVKRLPQMHLNGAFSAEKVYHKSEIDSIVKYAKYRGIRIIFEIDAPAHAAGHGFEWGEKSGLGKLAVCVDNQPWRKSCIQPNCGQLNPANENVYSVLRDIYQDINDYKEEGEYFHMGGDEVFMPCWNQTEEIVNYMVEKGFERTTEGFLELWSEFQEKALSKWDEIGGEDNSVILWSSELTLPQNIEKFLPKERYIIQTWIPSDSDVPIQLLKKGYRIIMSTKNAWYFDHGFWGNTKYYNWKTVYANMLPRSFLVLGGEVCMWSEYLDEFSIEMKIFPRLNAAAERLWTNPPTDFKNVESRFNRQRERILAKGINSDASIPEYCTIFEGECR